MTTLFDIAGLEEFAPANPVVRLEDLSPKNSSILPTPHRAHLLVPRPESRLRSAAVTLPSASKPAKGAFCLG
ncbi:MAG: hypothetical protein CM15mP18_3950 [Methanobacteriota archaeon]|nr:MAG: hypothetical protein CM15mP18_3950 [Euryarchaeota archaeon]